MAERMVPERAMLRRAAASRLRLGLLLAAAGLPARAEVTRFEVLSREAAALGGRTFGERGAAEKIVGRATIALDPADPRNAVIADLGLAPRNAAGRVEAMADVAILRPVRPNGVLLLELPNRGRRLLPGWANDADAVGGNRMERAEDAGNGFLLRQGYTVAWVGWQGDLAAGAGMRVAVPAVAGATGPAREEWPVAEAPGPQRATLTWPAAEPANGALTVRNRPDGERRTPPGLTVRFLDPRTAEIIRPEGVPAGATLELLYTARDPGVMGMGFAAVRDVAAFLRREGGEANPMAANGRSGIARAVGLGISQSGRALRDMLHLGFNEDERGRVVFDGMMPIIPGTRRSFTNARFGQPGRNPGPQFDRGFPVDQFPFTYDVTDDALSGRRDGLLLRCRLSSTCPRIIQADSEFEFWGSRASLLVTDTAGRHLDLPPEVRAYLFSGAPHGNPADAVMRPAPGCAMPLNPVNQGPSLRALLVAMERWVVEGVEPPSSRYPTRAAGTLVPAAQVYPVIPGLPYREQFVRARWVEQDAARPVERGEYPVLLPRAGLDGNAVGGIRLPILAAPLATYVGWNAQAGAAGTAAAGPEDLCTQVGGVVPFAPTREARVAAGDPRPSVAELYPAPGDYLAAVRDAAERLVFERLLLPEDAEAAMRAASEGRLAKLTP